MTLNITFDLLDKMRAIAERAGIEILKIYRTGFAVEKKADASPVTAADRAAEALITAAIRAEITDAFPIVAEEAFAQGTTPDVGVRPFWLVDPLDGTKEFVARNGEFTVNIALIENGRPVAGVVLAPALELAYWGGPAGAFRAKTGGRPERVSCRPVRPNRRVRARAREPRRPRAGRFRSARC